MSANVLDEDGASRAEISKAYIGSYTTPLNKASHCKKHGDSFASGNPSKSSALSVVPRSSRCVGVIENGFFTRRSEGRSAVYIMAGMANFRVCPTPSIKVYTLMRFICFIVQSSSSLSAWE